ncbi:hypothetical protein [Gordonia soli]|uniref:Uncharacterized protein n=1 Tax=Gordonia soli NBRC 108243 TaxID=1223545 RepID=M0QQZ9_9ACTN|nr:hypothetical protein [Gordonia soli]GAC71105.1 hypothetical protein GS4_57_00020 [Gordonia soli NBRC 108243]
MSDELKRDIMAAISHRLKHGIHLHHRDCIHNLAPEEQIAVRGRSVEWWMTVVGRMPEQITPDQWECEPPIAPSGRIPKSDGGGQQ